MEQVQYRAYEGTYQQERAIWLNYGQYEAAILPEYGGNLIAFRDIKNGYAFLREPLEGRMDKFRKAPGVFGIPILYPPNRYEDGLFTWRGTEYRLPVNEAKTGNHIHGYLHTSPWEVEDFGATAHESHVTVKITIDETHVSYQYLPFKYTVRLRYSLSENGLSQHFMVHNDGENEMPCLFAFHTAVKAPFAPQSQAKDYRVKVTIGERWEMTKRKLPTGSYQSLSQEEQLMQGEGVYPFFAPMDNHYTVRPQNGRNRMELTDLNLGVTLVYDVGASYKQWMIWNNEAREGFFCPEPQINLVNAPNLDLPAEEVGLFSLHPGEIWEESARFYVK